MKPEPRNHVNDWMFSELRKNLESLTKAFIAMVNGGPRKDFEPFLNSGHRYEYNHVQCVGEIKDPDNPVCDWCGAKGEAIITPSLTGKGHFVCFKRKKTR